MNSIETMNDHLLVTIPPPDIGYEGVEISFCLSPEKASLTEALKSEAGFGVSKLKEAERKRSLIQRALEKDPTLAQESFALVHDGLLPYEELDVGNRDNFKVMSGIPQLTHQRVKGVLGALFELPFTQKLFGDSRVTPPTTLYDFSTKGIEQIEGIVSPHLMSRAMIPRGLKIYRRAFDDQMFFPLQEEPGRKIDLIGDNYPMKLAYIGIIHSGNEHLITKAVEELESPAMIIRPK